MGKVNFSPIVITFFVGITIRLWLFNASIADWLAEKHEISTPLTSWKRVTEGLALYRSGISPYSGDVFHEMPLILRVLNYLTNLLGEKKIQYIFIACDVITAIILERIARHFGKYMLKQQVNCVHTYHIDAEKILLKADQVYASRLYVVIAFLLNPYGIASCLAKSTAVFNNMVIALAILYTLKGSHRACLFIVIAAYMSMYPIMLIVPTAIHFARESLAKNESLWSVRGMEVMTRLVIGTLVGLGGLLYLSYMLEGSWDFLGSTYGFILSVPDLTPNMGLFWYFFTEMFDHFRLFFICVFQINAFIYTVPLAIRLRDHPIFLMYSLVALMAIFKSYPSYGDVALYLAMLPLWKHCFPYMRNNLVVVCMFMVCAVLAPILWYLWIYAGSANANFYFAITLVYATAQIFLVTDLIFAYLRREFDLLNGTKPKIIDGQPAPIILD